MESRYNHHGVTTQAKSLCDNNLDPGCGIVLHWSFFIFFVSIHWFIFTQAIGLVRVGGLY